MTMYGIIVCSGCQRQRIIDLGDEVTKCPYCGDRSVTKKARIVYMNEDQSIVRGFLDASAGFVAEKRHMDESIDPMSSLEYKVEHTTDVREKMSVIAEGLTRIKGTFTVEDVDSLVPGKGEKYVKAMLDECMIYEVKYGMYKA